MQNTEQNFHCAARKSITGLHVKLSGMLEHCHVAEFADFIQNTHAQGQRLFLDVRSLSVAGESLRNAFKACFAHIPAKQVIFKGEQGVQLGHHGNRVLFMKDSPCKCAGACKSCACDSRVKDRNVKYVFKKGQSLAV